MYNKTQAYENFQRVKQELLIKLNAAMVTGRYELLPGLSREMKYNEEKLQASLLNNNK